MSNMSQGIYTYMYIHIRHYTTCRGYACTLTGFQYFLMIFLSCGLPQYGNTYNVQCTQARVQCLSTYCMLYMYVKLHSMDYSEAHALNRGTNLVHSCCQLCRVEAGATTRKGPHIPWRYERERIMKMCMKYT